MQINEAAEPNKNHYMVRESVESVR